MTPKPTGELKRARFWATAPGTEERRREEAIARAEGLELRELKFIEAFVLATNIDIPKPR